MPYIKQERREELFDNGEYHTPETAGELNFMFSQIIKNYLDENVKNYAAFNAVIGALECAKLEVYRRLAAPYEDVKIKENGDVY